MKAHLVILVGLLLSSCAIDSTTKEVHDTIIIGGGLMGSSTAWHLSDQGNSVLLLEKQDSVYTQGSSFGEARIARSSNRGNDTASMINCMLPLLDKTSIIKWLSLPRRVCLYSM